MTLKSSLPQSSCLSRLFLWQSGRVLGVHPERVAAMGEMEKQNHRHMTTNLPLVAYLVYVMN